MLNRIIPGLLAALAIMACTASDEKASAPAATPVEGNFIEGTLIFEKRLSATSNFSVYKDGEHFMKSATSNIDNDKDIIPLLQEAMAKPTLAETYEALGAISPNAGPLPAALADLDARGPDAAPAKETAIGVPDMENPGPAAAPAGAPLAKAAAGEPDWDWDADERWFKDMVRSRSPYQKEWFAIGGGEPWINRHAYKFSCGGLTASHIAGARFKSWREDCDLFSCDWIQKANVYLEPRTLWFLEYDDNKGAVSANRKFQMVGQAPHKFVDLGLMYNTSKNHSNATADLALTITSFKADNLKYTVTNKGKTTITNPIVRRTLTPTADNPVSDETLKVTLAPGESFNRTVYVPEPMFHAELRVDPDNKIQEFDEMNNVAVANESN
jgi:hypothetical protein